MRNANTIFNFYKSHVITLIRYKLKEKKCFILFKEKWGRLKLFVCDCIHNTMGSFLNETHKKLGIFIS